MLLRVASLGPITLELATGVDCKEIRGADFAFVAVNIVEFCNKKVKSVMVKTKKWVLAQSYDGAPKECDFRLEEEEVPAPGDGEFLCEAVYLSVDPYMRSFKYPVGSVIIGEQVARVIESKEPDYPVGTFVQFKGGWRTVNLVNPGKSPPELRLMKVPDLGGMEPSLALGAVGMPAMAGYFGLLEICQPKAGETVLVSAASGAVGSIVGQIAKIKGCKVIGFAGTETKCDWVKKCLGFDHVFNYKVIDVDQAIKQVAPEGIDCYFDNVGGDFTVKVLPHMKMFGRIAVCGSISTYNAGDDQPAVPNPFYRILFQQLKVEGFLVGKWIQKWPDAKAEILRWIKEGKIKYKETVKEGFDKMPEAFISLLEGEGIGKMIVKA